MPLPAPFTSANKTLFLMDGTAYLYRGYYANSTLQRSDGHPTGALTVVARVLLRILRSEKPARFVFFKDGHGKNFRHELYPEYKANRTATPEGLVQQLEPVRRMVEALGLHYEESQGCEADDCIASLAKRYAGECPVVIVSGDKDLKQCLGPNVIMWDPGSREEKITTAAEVEKENGIPISLWPDLQALTGDSVDNIPGVPGIGPKTALQILKDLPGLEAIRDHFALVSPKFQKKLDGHLEEMFLWRRLTTMATDRCEHLTLDDLAVRPVDVNAAVQLAKEFELRALMRDIMSLGRKTAKPSAAEGSAAEAVAQGSGQAESAPLLTDASAKDKPVEGVEDLERDEGSCGTVQGLSLLDIARTSSTAELASVSSAAELFDCTGRRAAVIWPEEGKDVCVAAAEGASEEKPFECLYTGPEQDLVSWAAKASLLIVPSAKALMKRNAFWHEEVLRRIKCGTIYDLGIAAWLFSPDEGRYSWQYIVGFASQAGFAQGNTPGSCALALGKWGRARLEREGLSSLYDNLELPLVPVLAGMEEAGVKVDMLAFQNFLGEVRQELSMLTQDIYDGAGMEFNIRSSQQLAQVLYEHLGLKCTRKTSSGKYSTSQETLEGLAGNAVVDNILRYRKLEKMRSTYLEPLPRLTDEEGRLHTTFNQQGTGTGRLSSSNPNLQNIPVRGSLGRRMRSCFVAREGYSLISADYSQVELRVLAHMSRDEALLSAFARDEDIHARTAALVYDCEPSAVTPDQRRNAKTINFGLIYGMGAQKLAKEIGVKLAEAKKFIERYFASLTGIRDFYEVIDKNAHRDGYVTTIAGRRRPLPNINSNNAQEQALARRQAVNSVIQGSAADIIKLAMLAVWRDEELKSMGARLLLQVHDELLLEVPSVHAKEAGARAAYCMESVAPEGRPFEPRLKVEYGVAQDWGSAH